MKKYYFGAWQNFYDLNWPIRFLIELIIVICLLYFVLKVISKLENIFKLRVCLVKSLVWFFTEIIYLIGHNKAWAVEIDSKIVKWGQKAVSETGRNKHCILKKMMIVGMIILYFLAVFVDLPISRNIQEYYLVGLTDIQSFFQQCEAALSKGYEEYPPLFVRAESTEDSRDTTEVGNEILVSVVYIRLNKKGESGANIRQDPSLDGLVVGRANIETEILYKGQWLEDGERYWVKVSLPNESIEGWISGNLIESEQLKEIVNEFVE